MAPHSPETLQLCGTEHPTKEVAVDRFLASKPMSARNEADPFENAVVVSNLMKEGKIEEIPAPYVFPQQQRAGLRHDQFSDETTNIPIIDLAGLWSGDEEAIACIAEQVEKAAREWGFFHVINHGVSTDSITAIQLQGNKLFDLPFEQKMRDFTSARRRGYSCTPKPVTPAPGLIWSEGFTLVGSSQVDVAQHARKIWKDDLEQCDAFCLAVEDYGRQSFVFANALKQLLIKSLKVDPAHFAPYCDNATQILHLNHYPTCPDPTKVMGLNAHYDFGFFTFIAQDDVPGLQVFKNDHWFSVKPCPNAFCVNIADTFEALTNSRYRSNLHRVVVNSDRPRLSVTTFLATPFDVPVRPAPEFVTPEHPQLYRPFTLAEYFGPLREQHLDEISTGVHLLDFVRCT